MPTSPAKNAAQQNKQREKVKQRLRRQAEQQQRRQERQKVRQEIHNRLQQTTLLSAYDNFLRHLCRNGLPQPNNLYQLAAQFMIKWEKKKKEREKKRKEVQ